MPTRRFRRRLVFVDAIRWVGDNLDEITSWVRDGGGMIWSYNTGFGTETLVVQTTIGERLVVVGDWIMRSPGGEFYPIEDDDLNSTYELVDDLSGDVVDAVSPADLAATGDLAAEFGVGKAAVSNWIKRHADFPKPLTTLSTGPVYDRRQVREWYGRRDQTR